VEPVDPDRLRVAGTAEFDGENREHPHGPDRAPDSLDRSIVPDHRHLRGHPLGGAAPDPLRHDAEGRAGIVYYNTEHGHLGWTLSAATAYRVAALVSGDRPGHERPRQRSPEASVLAANHRVVRH